MRDKHAKMQFAGRLSYFAMFTELREKIAIVGFGRHINGNKALRSRYHI